MHYFEFHFQKIISATKGWKDDEFGAYVRLLMEQFDRGFVPDDPAEISRLITSYKKNWSLLKKKFAEPSEPGQLRNTFMVGIRNEAMEKRAKNAENGSKGGRAKKANAIANGTANAVASVQRTGKRNGSQPVTSNQEPKKEEKIKNKKASPEEWDYNPSPDTPIDLTEMEIGGAIQWVAALRQIDISASRISELWKGFKLKLTGKKFYQSRADLVDHFRNWLKDQDLGSKQITNEKNMVH